MIQMQTRLASGRQHRCQGSDVLQGARWQQEATAGIGDIIVCSVKSVIPGSDVKKKAVVKAVIVALQEAHASRRRQLRTVRHERLRDHRQRQESEGHPHLRCRGPRTPRPQFHENRQPGERGGVMLIRSGDLVEVKTGNARGTPRRCYR